jgi:hypothetical protein
VPNPDVSDESTAEFSRRTDAVVSAFVLLAIAGVVVALDVFADVPMTPLGTPVIALLVLLAAGFLLGLVVGLMYVLEDKTPLPVRPLDSRLGAYFDRLVDEGRPQVIGHVAAFAAGFGVLAALLASFFVVASVLMIVWMVPTVVWLSVIHDVPLADSVRYTLDVHAGRPEYDVLWFNTDPALIGHTIFTLVGWAVILALVAIPLLPFWLVWRWREHRRDERWLAEYRKRHGQ